MVGTTVRRRDVSLPNICGTGSGGPEVATPGVSAKDKFIVALKNFYQKFAPSNVVSFWCVSECVSEWVSEWVGGPVICRRHLQCLIPPLTLLSV